MQWGVIAHTAYNFMGWPSGPTRSIFLLLEKNHMCFCSSRCLSLTKRHLAHTRFSWHFIDINWPRVRRHALYARCWWIICLIAPSDTRSPISGLMLDWLPTASADHALHSSDKLQSVDNAAFYSDGCQFTSVVLIVFFPNLENERLCI